MDCQSARKGLTRRFRLPGASCGSARDRAIFHITRDIRGEARLVERAFGFGTSALAEAVQFVNQRLDLEAA